MESCSLHHWILFFIILIPVADLTVTSLMAKLHQPVTLTCNQKCSRQVTWKMFGNYVVARCDQFTCYSEKEYSIDHDQYRNGNLTLVIRSVDFSKRTIFTCYCDDNPVCGVLLTIEPWVSAVQMKPGEDMVLDLHIPEPTEVAYQSTHSVLPDGEWICTVNNDSLQCGTDYKQRASLNHTELTLRDLKLSDSGVYSIRHMKNKEVLHTYVVSVEEDLRPYWITGVVVIVVLVILLLAVVGKYLISHIQRKKQIQDLMERHKILEEILRNAKEEGEQSKARLNNISELMKLMVEVEELKKQYSNQDQSRFPYRISTKDDTVDVIFWRKRKTKIDELVDKVITGRPDLNELSELWSKMKTELDLIMKKRSPTESADPEVENQNDVAGTEQNSMRSDSVSQVDTIERRGKVDSIVGTVSFSNSIRPKYGPKTQETAEDSEKLNLIGARREQNQTSPHSDTGGEQEDCT